MSDDDSVCSDNDDAKSNADRATSGEYNMDPGLPGKEEAPQRNINEYSELTQSFVDEGFTEKESKSNIPLSYRNFVEIYRKSTYIDYSEFDSLERTLFTGRSWRLRKTLKARISTP